MGGEDPTKEAPEEEEKLEDPPDLMTWFPKPGPAKKKAPDSDELLDVDEQGNKVANEWAEKVSLSDCHVLLTDPADNAKTIKVPSHMMILSMNSHFFKDEIAGGKKEVPMPPLKEDPLSFLPKLVDIVSAQKLVLELFYNLDWSTRFDHEMKLAGEKGTGAELALGVFACSSMLRASRVVAKAALFVSDLITIHNAAGFMYAAELLGSAASINKEAAAALRANFSQLQGPQLRFFAQLPLPTLKSVLASTELTVDGEDESVVKDAVRAILYCRMEGAVKNFDFKVDKLQIDAASGMTGWEDEIQIQVLAFEGASYAPKGQTPYFQELKKPFRTQPDKEKDPKNPAKFTGTVEGAKVSADKITVGVPALGDGAKPTPVPALKEGETATPATDPASVRNKAIQANEAKALALTKSKLVVRCVHKDGRDGWRDGSALEALVPEDKLMDLLDEADETKATAKELVLDLDKDTKLTLTVTYTPAEKPPDKPKDPPKDGEAPPKERNPAFFEKEDLDELLGCVRWANMTGTGLHAAGKDPVMRKAGATEQITEALCFRLQQHEPGKGWGDVAQPAPLRKGATPMKKGGPGAPVQAQFPELELYWKVDMEQGVFHYLATKGFTERWTSPLRRGAVEVLLNKKPDAPSPLVHGSAEDLLAGAKKVAGAYGFGYLRTKNDLESAQLGIDLKAGYLELASYCLRNGSATSAVISSWELQGSNTGDLDDASWQILDVRRGDQGLRQSHATKNYKLNAKAAPYRYFRLKMTDKNSTGSYNLVLAGLELYGVLWPKGLPPGRRPEGAPALGA